MMSEFCIKSFGESAKMCLQGPSRAESSYWIKECHLFFWDLLGVTNLVPDLQNWLVGLRLDTRQLASFDISCSGAIAFYMFVPCGDIFGFQKLKKYCCISHECRLVGKAKAGYCFSALSFIIFRCHLFDNILISPVIVLLSSVHLNDLKTLG